MRGDEERESEREKGRQGMRGGREGNEQRQKENGRGTADEIMETEERENERDF